MMAATSQARETPLARAQRIAETQKLRAQADQTRLQRRVIKERAKAVKMLSGSYPQTKRTRLSGAFGGKNLPSDGSGDMHFDPATQDLARREARHLARTSGLAAAIIGMLADCISGGIAGPQVQFLSADTKWNDLAEAWFKAWWEDPEARGMCDGAGMCTQLIEAAARDGDVGVIPLESGKVQIVESDCIGGGPGGKFTTLNNESLAGGVEKDRLGRPVAFWVGKHGTLGVKDPVRISADEFWFLAQPIGKRTSQTRGEPVLTLAIKPLRQLEEFMESTDASARLAAMTAAAIYTENPAATQASMPGETPADESGTSGETQKEEEWGPASVIHLKNGEKIELLKPEQPTTLADAWVRLRVRMIGSNICLPLEFILLDFSQVNFHSGRAAMIIAWRRFTRWQAWFKRFLTKLCRWRIQKAIYDGDLPMPSDGRWMDHKWTLPPMPAIDELQEMQGKAYAIASKLKSRRQAIEELGFDFETVEAQLLEEFNRDQANGNPAAIPAGMMVPVPVGAKKTKSAADSADKNADPNKTDEVAP
jgi:lambda family phage portal protein